MEDKEIFFKDGIFDEVLKGDREVLRVFWYHF